MTGEERRQEILNTIMTSGHPISGRTLAAQYHVSRQVIVQDVALLRAGNYEIMSTPRGYIFHHSPKVQRVITVCHTDEQIEDELNTVVDMGGRVLDVFVNHEVYGNLRAQLSVFSRRNVKELQKSLESGESMPLKNLTSGVHCHTIEADSEGILDLIIEELKVKNYYLHDGE